MTPKFAKLTVDQNLRKAQADLNPAPCSVEMTTRQVIEHKLLTGLEDENKVAILATRQDLEDLLAACEHNQFRHALRARCTGLATGMRQLLREAFPPNAEAASSGSTGSSAPISDEVADLLTNIAQIMDGWRNDESWSPFDQCQRERITSLLEAYYQSNGR